jgi:hydrogenase expression/formation protein HypD
MTVEQLEKGTHNVENAYARVVSFEGNQPAQEILKRVYEPCDRNWRGIGFIPMSGWKLRPEFVEFDAEQKFSVGNIHTQESPICLSGQILQGMIKPRQCPAFGTLCTPEYPLGATMVSSEGTCAAYYRYAREVDSHE